MAKNTQIQTYLDNDNIKQHERELLDMILAYHSEEKFSSVLDIGCATGKFLALLKRAIEEVNVVGLDISESLIKVANERNIPAAQFIVGDALAYEPQEKFDLIIASGVMSIFSDFRVPLSTWLNWLSSAGRLIIFGRFNSRHIDTRVEFLNHYQKDAQWEQGLTSYSVTTVQEFLELRGYAVRFRRFHLEIDLGQHPDPIRTYTRTLSDGERLVVNGANILAEQYFATVVKI